MQVHIITNIDLVQLDGMLHLQVHFEHQICEANYFNSLISNESRQVFSLECVLQIIFFIFFSTKTLCCGHSFEHPKQMLKLMDKKMFTILRSKFRLSVPMKVYITHIRPQGYKTFYMLNSNELLIKTKIPTNDEISCFKSLRCCIYHADES